MADGIYQVLLDVPLLWAVLKTVRFRKNEQKWQIRKFTEPAKSVIIQRKRPEIFEISGLGGDKRDRTAVLLNAIGFRVRKQWK